MKLREVSCEQFAGIRDRKISFSDGINIVYGKNESGKSTLVNLISRILFQNSRIDGRRDKGFRELYFPGALKGKVLTGDFVNGKLTFETENGTYILSKEWGVDPRCTLSTPDGIIRDEKSINTVLKDALRYGEGVYSDMLFSSQRNTDISLQTILDDSKNTDAKQEIIDVVSQAFAESGGISVDAVEQALNLKIEEIIGKHWDVEREAPARNRKGERWSKGVGIILKAYYDLEDAKAELEKISQMQRDVDSAEADFDEKDKAASDAEDAYNKFNTFATQLILRNESRKNMKRLDDELRKIEKILALWPEIEDGLEKAKILKTEKSDREAMDKYTEAKKIVDELNGLDSDTAALPCPDDSEIIHIKKAQSTVTKLENELCGMNLSAAIKMFGDNKVKITSLITGEEIRIDDGKTEINEAVNITVPGVMEMQLFPANIDVAEVETRISEQKEAIKSVLSKYKADNIEELELLAKKITNEKEKIEFAENRLSVILGDTVFEELEEQVRNINAVVRLKKEIDEDISRVCGDLGLDNFIIQKKTIINGYTADYGSIGELKAHAYDLENERGKAREAASLSEEIPVEYRSVKDPEEHLEKLQKDWKIKQEIRERALNAKTASVSKLENYKENISVDPLERVEKAKRIYEEQESLLRHWQHILDVFNAQKESIHNDPMQDIAEQFTHYLGVISSGKVSSEFPETDKLNMNIYSDDRLLDYEKLSEGTKETVSLAFRLAVLDHLFPDGGGVIVFDDPFNDMDDERVAQSCKLITECAERHQVIFLTCREEYLSVLNGNKVILE